MNSNSNQLTNPFPGLRPFEENESFLFFGREKHLEDIFQKLNSHRFVALVGSSGSGKSSLVKAGIIPKIKHDPNWVQTSLRPGTNPVENLAFALHQIFNLEIADLRETLNRSSFGLVEIIRKNLPKEKNIFFLVDQFEEIFRFDQATDMEGNRVRSHFMDLLLEAYSQRDIGIYIMLTLRSDFVGECDLFYGLPEAMNDGQYLIPRLKKEELERIITGPVLHAGGKIAPRLVQRLVADIDYNPDQLPVLQHVLMRAWEIWEPISNSGKPIDFEHYELTGGIKNALDNHAEEAFARLTPFDQTVAESIFSAITTKTTDNRGIRRPLKAKNVSDIAGVDLSVLWRCVSPFRESGTAFLIPTINMPAEAESILDISHESLMRNWRRLSNWVEEEYESANFYRRLVESAKLYAKGKTGLWRDPDLQIAVSWKEKQKPTPMWAALYDEELALSLRFIEESNKEKSRGIAEQKRRRIISRAAVASFLATSGILTLWAFRERNTSDQNASKALTEQKKAEDQQKIAIEQSKLARVQELKAEQNLIIAQTEQKETEKQKRIAEENSQEAAVQRELAEQASLIANEQRIAAIREKAQAILQKQISDSLRVVSVKSEIQANRLRLLALADNLAIKSKQLRNSEDEKNVKGILALESYRLMNENNGNLRDPELFEALQSAALGEKSNKTIFHSDMLKGICFVGSSNKIATCGDDGNIFLTENGSSQLLLNKKEDILENITSSANGELLAFSGRENHNIYILNVANKSEKIITKPHLNNITGILILDNLILSTSLDNHFRVCNINNLNNAIINFTAPDRVTGLAKSKSNSVVYFTCENGDIYSYNLENPTVNPTLFANFHNGKPNCIAISTDGNTMATGNFEGNIVVINVRKKEIIENIQLHNSKIEECTMNENGFLATVSLDKTVKIIDLTKSDSKPILLQEQGEWALALAFSPNGKTLASGGKEKALYINEVDVEHLTTKISQSLTRNLTESEWNKYIGRDIPYHKTNIKLPDNK